jgi:hypothetical protein
MSEITSHLQALLPQTKFEKITDGVAVMGTVSPFWLPWLKQWSDMAYIVMPLAGLTWLIVQIVAKILVTRKILKGNGKH